MKELASLIAEYEGKKHQASIGDIREILRILEEVFADELRINKGLLFGDFCTRVFKRAKK